MTTYPHPACMEPDGGEGPCRGYQVLQEQFEAEHAIVDRVWKALGITDYASAKGKAIDELVAEMRVTLLNLANAADAVGVRFFDTDTMEPEVEAMQTATQAARAALR